MHIKTASLWCLIPLQTLALLNRPDVALIAASVRAAETNLSLQQSVIVRM